MTELSEQNHPAVSGAQPLDPLRALYTSAEVVLLRACEAGDIRKLRKLLHGREEGTKIDGRELLLSVAASVGNNAVIQLLAQFGANVSNPGNDGRPFAAMHFAYEAGHFDTANLLAALADVRQARIAEEMYYSIGFSKPLRQLIESLPFHQYRSFRDAIHPQKEHGRRSAIESTYHSYLESSEIFLETQDEQKLFEYLLSSAFDEDLAAATFDIELLHDDSVLTLTFSTGSHHDGVSLVRLHPVSFSDDSQIGFQLISKTFLVFDRENRQLRRSDGTQFLEKIRQFEAAKEAARENENLDLPGKQNRMRRAL